MIEDGGALPANLFARTIQPPISVDALRRALAVHSLLSVSFPLCSPPFEAQPGKLLAIPLHPHATVCPTICSQECIIKP